MITKKIYLNFIIISVIIIIILYLIYKKNNIESFTTLNCNS